MTQTIKFSKNVCYEQLIKTDDETYNNVQIIVSDNDENFHVKYFYIIPNFDSTQHFFFTNDMIIFADVITLINCILYHDDNFEHTSHMICKGLKTDENFYTF